MVDRSETAGELSPEALAAVNGYRNALTQMVNVQAAYADGVENVDEKWQAPGQWRYQNARKNLVASLEAITKQSELVDLHGPARSAIAQLGERRTTKTEDRKVIGRAMSACTPFGNALEKKCPAPPKAAESTPETTPVEQVVGEIQTQTADDTLDSLTGGGGNDQLQGGDEAAAVDPELIAQAENAGMGPTDTIGKPVINDGEAQDDSESNLTVEAQQAITDFRAARAALFAVHNNQAPPPGAPTGSIEDRFNAAYDDLLAATEQVATHVNVNDVYIELVRRASKNKNVRRMVELGCQIALDTSSDLAGELSVITGDAPARNEGQNTTIISGGEGGVVVRMSNGQLSVERDGQPVELEPVTTGEDERTRQNQTIADLLKASVDELRANETTEDTEDDESDTLTGDTGNDTLIGNDRPEEFMSIADTLAAARQAQPDQQEATEADRPTVTVTSRTNRWIQGFLADLADHRDGEMVPQARLRRSRQDYRRYAEWLSNCVENPAVQEAADAIIQSIDAHEFSGAMSNGIERPNELLNDLETALNALDYEVNESAVSNFEAQIIREDNSRTDAVQTGAQQQTGSETSDSENPSVTANEEDPLDTALGQPADDDVLSDSGINTDAGTAAGGVDSTSDPAHVLNDGNASVIDGQPATEDSSLLGGVDDSDLYAGSDLHLDGGDSDDDLLGASDLDLAADSSIEQAGGSGADFTQVNDSDLAGSDDGIEFTGDDILPLTHDEIYSGFTLSHRDDENPEKTDIDVDGQFFFHLNILQNVRSEFDTLTDEIMDVESNTYIAENSERITNHFNELQSVAEYFAARDELLTIQTFARRMLVNLDNIQEEKINGSNLFTLYRLARGLEREIDHYNPSVTIESEHTVLVDNPDSRPASSNSDIRIPTDGSGTFELKSELNLEVSVSSEEYQMIEHLREDVDTLRDLASEAMASDNNEDFMMENRTTINGIIHRTRATTNHFDSRVTNTPQFSIACSKWLREMNEDRFREISIDNMYRFWLITSTLFEASDNYDFVVEETSADTISPGESDLEVIDANATLNETESSSGQQREGNENAEGEPLGQPIHTMIETQYGFNRNSPVHAEVSSSMIAEPNTPSHLNGATAYIRQGGDTLTGILDRIRDDIDPDGGFDFWSDDSSDAWLESRNGEAPLEEQCAEALRQIEIGLTALHGSDSIDVAGFVDDWREMKSQERYGLRLDTDEEDWSLGRRILDPNILIYLVDKYLPGLLQALPENVEHTGDEVEDGNPTGDESDSSPNADTDLPASDRIDSLTESSSGHMPNDEVEEREAVYTRCVLNEPNLPQHDLIASSYMREGEGVLSRIHADIGSQIRVNRRVDGRGPAPRGFNLELRREDGGAGTNERWNNGLEQQCLEAMRQIEIGLRIANASDRFHIAPFVEEWRQMRGNSDYGFGGARLEPQVLPYLVNDFLPRLLGSLPPDEELQVAPENSADSAGNPVENADSANIESTGNISQEPLGQPIDALINRNVTRPLSEADRLMQATFERALENPENPELDAIATSYIREGEREVSRILARVGRDNIDTEEGGFELYLALGDDDTSPSEEWRDGLEEECLRALRQVEIGLSILTRSNRINAAEFVEDWRIMKESGQYGLGQNVLDPNILISLADDYLPRLLEEFPTLEESDQNTGNPADNRGSSNETISLDTDLADPNENPDTQIDPWSPQAAQNQNGDPDLLVNAGFGTTLGDRAATTLDFDADGDLSEELTQDARLTLETLRDAQSELRIILTRSAAANYVFDSAQRERYRNAIIRMRSAAQAVTEFTDWDSSHSAASSFIAATNADQPYHPDAIEANQVSRRLTELTGTIVTPMLERLPMEEVEFQTDGITVIPANPWGPEAETNINNDPDLLINAGYPLPESGDRNAELIIFDGPDGDEFRVTPEARLTMDTIRHADEQIIAILDEISGADDNEFNDERRARYRTAIQRLRSAAHAVTEFRAWSASYSAAGTLIQTTSRETYHPDTLEAEMAVQRLRRLRDYIETLTKSLPMNADAQAPQLELRPQRDATPQPRQDDEFQLQPSPEMMLDEAEDEELSEDQIRFLQAMKHVQQRLTRLIQSLTSDDYTPEEWDNNLRAYYGGSILNTLLIEIGGFEESEDWPNSERPMLRLMAQIDSTSGRYRPENITGEEAPQMIAQFESDFLNPILDQIPMGRVDTNRQSDAVSQSMSTDRPGSSQPFDFTDPENAPPTPQQRGPEAQSTEATIEHLRGNLTAWHEGIENIEADRLSAEQTGRQSARATEAVDEWWRDEGERRLVANLNNCMRTLEEFQTLDDAQRIFNAEQRDVIDDFVDDYDPRSSSFRPRDIDRIERHLREIVRNIEGIGGGMFGGIGRSIRTWWANMMADVEDEGTANSGQAEAAPAEETTAPAERPADSTPPAPSTQPRRQVDQDDDGWAARMDGKPKRFGKLRDWFGRMMEDVEDETPPQTQRRQEAEEGLSGPPATESQPQQTEDDGWAARMDGKPKRFGRLRDWWNRMMEDVDDE